MATRMKRQFPYGLALVTMWVLGTSALFWFHCLVRLLQLRCDARPRKPGNRPDHQHEVDRRLGRPPPGGLISVSHAIALSGIVAAAVTGVIGVLLAIATVATAREASSSG